MKRSGPAASARSTALLGLGMGAEQAGEAVVGAHVAQPGVDVVADERADGVAEDDGVGDLHHGGLEVHGEEHALRLGLGDLLREERLQRGAAHDRRVDDLAREERRGRLEDRDRAVGGATCSMRTSVGSATVTDRSVERKSPSLIVDTCVWESDDHAPIECGCLRTNALTDAGARRSELPSRSTGLTALPFTAS